MGNRYYPVNGKELASVTTVTGLADKSDALIPWAVNCAVDYVDRQVYHIELDTGKIDISVLEDARTKWREVRDEAGDIGTQVHDLLEIYLKWIQGDATDLPTQDEINPQAWELFGAACDKLKELGDYTVLATEQKVVNEDEWYAGRFDALLEVSGETWLIDFKTGKSFYPEWGMQLAAYAEAWEFQRFYNLLGEWVTGGGKTSSPPNRSDAKVDRIKVLRLDKTTLKAYWKEYGGEKDTLTRENYMTAFLGLRDAFYILKAKKAVKLAWLEGQR